jgi:hypothetical protein
MKDVKGGKKSQKRCPQQAAATIGRYDDDDDKQVDSSDMEHITTAGCSVKRPTRPLTDHFERVLKEAYCNHMYPVKHRLKDCNMMNFMAPRSLTRDMEPEEDPGGRDAMPFTRKDKVMTVYSGLPSPRRHYMSNLCPGTPTHCGWEPGGTGV